MDIPIRLTGLENQNLALRAAGFSGPQLLLDGNPVVKQKDGFFKLKSDSGSLLAIKFKNRFLDPIPDLIVGGRTLTLVPPLQWYQYAAMALPLILLFLGGALGGLIGGIGAYMNSRIFRSDLNEGMKYGLVMLVSITAFITYAIAAAFLLAALKK